MKSVLLNDTEQLLRPVGTPLPHCERPALPQRVRVIRISVSADHGAAAMISSAAYTERLLGHAVLGDHVD